MSRPRNELTPIAVYGATGHTGRFVVEELRRRGYACRAVGRNAEALHALGTPGFRVATLDDRVAMADAFRGASVVINCAGPFLDTAVPVIRAAMKAGAHYLDVTAEQQSVRDTFADFDAIARAKHLRIVPASGFFGGLAELLVAVALGDWAGADSATIDVLLDNWRPTKGTRATGTRSHHLRVVLRDGEFFPVAGTATYENWDFGAPHGRVPVAPVPLSEIITIARHGKNSRIDSLMNRSALADLIDTNAKGPQASDERGRSAQRFVMDVRVEKDGEVRRATESGQDIYAVTAPLVVEAALRIIVDRAAVTGGCVTLSQLGNPGDFLAAIADAYPGFVFAEATANRRQLPSCELQVLPTSAHR